MFKKVLRATLAVVPTLLAADPSRAHVSLDSPEGTAGSPYRAALRVSHGCEGDSATTTLRVVLPEGARDARPMAKPGWRISTTRRPLPAPVPDGHGGTVADAVGEVLWEGGPLPGDQFDEFVVRFRTPDRPGETVWLPATQLCEGGRSVAWTEIPADGADARTLRRPAAALRLAAAPGAAAPVRAERAWSRPALAGGTGAGFLTLRNDGAAPDRLLGASSPLANRVELHSSSTEDGVMRMRPLDNVPVPAGGEATLRPGGTHLMLLDLRQPLRAGDRVPLLLRFERAGEVAAELTVRAPGAGEPAAETAHRH